VGAAGIRIEKVSKRFSHRVKGEVYAARDVSLDVAPGEFVTLLGPSGCGKTTTLRMIAGFETPNAGRITIGGEDITGLPVNRRNIGFVFQNYALFPHLSVFENVAYGLQVRERPRAELEREVGEVLALVGLAAYGSQFPNQLSGGEQQRVALARAIVIKPRVLLFDEPLSNLDARLRVQMRREIRELQKRLAITTVYVTHDQEEAMAVSDRIAVMNGGTIVQIGSAEDLYLRPADEFVAQFIGRVNLIPGSVAGAAVRRVVRPEMIRLSRAAGTGRTDSILTGTILSRTYLGEKTEYLVSCAGQTLQVACHGTGPEANIAEGTQVSVLLPENVALLP
jgi:iron(III) transport system ATP-binding protein